MFFDSHSKNKASVGKNSNGNLIVQDSIFHNPVFVSSDNEMLNVLGKIGQYDMIQEKVAAVLSAARKTHPLFPEFSATFDPKLNKLVSTPETENAFRNHPKVIKGKYSIDYSKYPYMDKSETPWAYAYRTQTQVELETIAYKEFLGDMEDPFPVMTFSEGMQTIIGAPEFPEASHVILKSGDILIPIMLRRLPCLEYGKVVLGNTSEGHGFDIRLTINDSDPKTTTVTLTKTENVDLATQLIREKFIDNMRTTREFKILSDNTEIMSTTLTEDDLRAEIFNTAYLMINYIQSLITIEEYVGCHFDYEIGEISTDEYYDVLVAAASLEGKWCTFKLDFDDAIRCRYDRIPDGFDDPEVSELSAQMVDCSITLHGIAFSADKYIVAYVDARVNNCESIKKNIRRKRNDILITVKPRKGKDFLLKHVRLEGLKVLA